MAFRAAVLEAYLAECCVCGFSLRLVDGLIGVDAAHIQWHSHGGPDEVPNGLALCALHHRVLDHGAITVGEDLRVRVARWRAVRPGACSRSSTVRRSGCRSTCSSTPTWGTCAGITPRSSRAGVTAVGPEGGGSLSSLRERRQGSYKAARLGEARGGSCASERPGGGRGGAQGSRPSGQPPLTAWGRT
jgi:hypothetical protein